MQTVVVYEEKGGEGLGYLLGLLFFSIPFTPFIVLGWRVGYYSYAVWHWHLLFCWIAGITMFIVSLAICITVIALLPRFIAALAGAIYFGLGAFYLTSGRSRHLVFEDFDKDFFYTNDPVWIGFWSVLFAVIGALMFIGINIIYGKAVNVKPLQSFTQMV